MTSTIQARLDDHSRKLLRQLVRRTGWPPSEVVREGIRLLAACHLGNTRSKITGLGKFDSGIDDLGSNKQHLKRVGR